MNKPTTIINITTIQSINRSATNLIIFDILPHNTAVNKIVKVHSDPITIPLLELITPINAAPKYKDYNCRR